MKSWSMMQVKHICNVPIILLGDIWEGLLDWLKENPLRRKMFEKGDFDLLYNAKTPDEAIKIIEKTHQMYLKGDPNICLNYKRYRVD